jgi:hypothetical protein
MYTHRHTEHTQISMPLMGFEPTISEFERAKIVRALDRAATAIGRIKIGFQNFSVQIIV